MPASVGRDNVCTQVSGVQLIHCCVICLQDDTHLLAELQVVLADKAALEEEKAAAQVRGWRQRSLSKPAHPMCFSATSQHVQGS